MTADFPFSGAGYGGGENVPRNRKKKTWKKTTTENGFLGAKMKIPRFKIVDVSREVGRIHPRLHSLGWKGYSAGWEAWGGRATSEASVLGANRCGAWDGGDAAGCVTCGGGRQLGTRLRRFSPALGSRERRKCTLKNEKGNKIDQI